MNNESESNSPQVLQTPADELSLQDSVNSETSLEAPLGAPNPNQVVDIEPPKRMSRRRILGLALLVTGIIASGLLVMYSINANKQQNATDAKLLTSTTRIKPQAIALPDLSKQLDDASTQELSTLTINGQANVSDSLVLQPTSRPDDAVTGQIYYDQGTDRLAFYNGKQFINLQGAVSTQVINVIGGDTVTNVFGESITNITNISGGGGVTANNGTVGALAMFTGTASIGDSLITQSGSTINVGSNATGIQIGDSDSNHNIQIGTGAGVEQVAIGSDNTTSATTIQAGTGDLALLTGSNTGVSGNISITTGNSSTTASGNINIDAGAGIVDGELVSSKSFESGLDNLTPWFGTTLAQSTDQARTGTYSLAETGIAAFEGIIENVNFPLTAVTPGHQYYFSFWIRAATTPRTINITVLWGNTTINTAMTPTVDSTSGWTEVTGLAVAPAGATNTYITITHAGAVGEVHYFDDFTITDLSSASAISALSLGSTNAKIVTIGNLNQIGTTSIYGGSGITLNSGAGNFTATGGVMTLTGNAASSLSTTSGALTLTSAAAATWSVGSASAGDGGNLTLRAGNAGADGDNDGGDIILQGGNPNAAGLPGSIIIRPQTDTIDSFQIQNSASAALFTADTSASIITVSGTAASFGALVLDNAHFKSSQTTAPTIATPTNCGTTPAATVTNGSTDSAGSFSITTGTGGTSSSCDTTITFDKPYGATPKSILVGAKTSAPSAARQIYVSTANTTSFTVSFANSAAGADTTTYDFNYWVVE